jgi:hypothetical protein
MCAITECNSDLGIRVILPIMWFPRRFADAGDQDTLEVTGISASGVNVVIHVHTRSSIQNLERKKSF